METAGQKMLRASEFKQYWSLDAAFMCLESGEGVRWRNSQ